MCAVLYPFSLRTSATVAHELGRIDVYPGADEANSVITPNPTL
jgi:hypothetical protein